MYRETGANREEARLATMMIVEDDMKIAHLHKGYIEKYGYQAVVVDDFAHVMERFRQVQPDLVLLDVNLPMYDGYYWCRRMRNESDYNRLARALKREIQNVKDGEAIYLASRVANPEGNLRLSHVSLQKDGRSFKVKGAVLPNILPLSNALVVTDADYGQMCRTLKQERVINYTAVGTYPETRFGGGASGGRTFGQTGS